MRMKQCSIICNVESGKGFKMKDFDYIVNILEKYGYDTAVYITEYPGHARELVQNMEYADLVISIGGDGTFNEVLSGNFLRKEKMLLSHIPTGTTNDIGIMFGLGKNIFKNVKDILSGEVRQVDVGLINDQPFMYVAGFGKFVTVTYETQREHKKIFGYLAYFVNAVIELFKKTKVYDIECKVDCVAHYGSFSLLLVSNATRIAGFDNIHRDIKLDDDKLEILLCSQRKRNDILKAIVQVKIDGAEKTPGIKMLSGSDIKIKFFKNPKKHWTVDGEEYVKDDQEYHITIDQHVNMLIPKKNISKLFDKV